MALPPTGDTIAAISTAPGTGAVGIVRISGPSSLEVADALLVPAGGAKPSGLPANRATFGRIVNGATLVDEAIMLNFRAPRSYTGQDVIELQTHGGPAVLRQVLELAVSHGARLAGPGEFTLRAYLNGRIDLVQAESVLGLVNAQSEAARRQAAFGLSRELSRQLDDIQTALTRVYGNIQAVVDYPEEGVEDSDRIIPLQEVITRIDALLATAKAGSIAVDGARLALVGPPNAGKSSLLNSLLGYERSLVSEIPGTTRDYLEAPMNIEGVPITAIDTAGIRETGDLIEASGVERAIQLARDAHLALCLIDGSKELLREEYDLINSLDPERTLVLASKSDLPHAWTGLENGAANGFIRVSAITGEGLSELRQAIRDRLTG